MRDLIQNKTRVTLVDIKDNSHHGFITNENEKYLYFADDLKGQVIFPLSSVLYVSANIDSVYETRGLRSL